MASPFTVGNQTTNGNGQWDAFQSPSGSKWQVIVTASELTAGGMVSGSQITRVDWLNYNTDPSNISYTDYRWRIGHTTKGYQDSSMSTTYASNFDVDGSILCWFAAGAVNGPGDTDWRFQDFGHGTYGLANFSWNGTNNVVFQGSCDASGWHTVNGNTGTGRDCIFSAGGSDADTTGALRVDTAGTDFAFRIYFSPPTDVIFNTDAVGTTDAAVYLKATYQVEAERDSFEGPETDAVSGAWIQCSCKLKRLPPGDWILVFLASHGNNTLNGSSAVRALWGATEINLSRRTTTHVASGGEPDAGHGNAFATFYRVTGDGITNATMEYRQYDGGTAYVGQQRILALSLSEYTEGTHFAYYDGAAVTPLAKANSSYETLGSALAFTQPDTDVHMFWGSVEVSYSGNSNTQHQVQFRSVTDSKSRGTERREAGSLNDTTTISFMAGLSSNAGGSYSYDAQVRRVAGTGTATFKKPRLFIWRYRDKTSQIAERVFSASTVTTAVFDDAAWGAIGSPNPTITPVRFSQVIQWVYARCQRSAADQACYLRTMNTTDTVLTDWQGYLTKNTNDQLNLHSLQVQAIDPQVKTLEGRGASDTNSNATWVQSEVLWFPLAITIPAKRRVITGT